MVWLRSVLAALLIAASLPATALGQSSLRAGAHWHPAPSTAAWQWQLQGRLDPSLPAAVYDVDGFEATKAEVGELHRRGKRVVCYLDVGSWESYRPDRDRFPAAVIGRRYEGFPDERWLDVSRFRLFRAPLEARIAMCARKGFDAVEPDNLAGFENETGFAIGPADQLRFNRWIAAQVHRRGMAVALKNDPRQVPQLLASFDFAVVEECFQFDECGRFSPFIAAGKAVLEAEYELAPEQFCERAAALGFSAIRKSYDLFARPWEPCDPAAKLGAAKEPRPPEAHTLGVERGWRSYFREGVVLLGLVETHGTPTRFRFEWGRTRSYGHRAFIPGEETYAYNLDQPVEVEGLTGRLKPNTTYHYRMVVWNGAGKSVGRDRSFHTPRR